MLLRNCSSRNRFIEFHSKFIVDNKLFIVYFQQIHQLDFMFSDRVPAIQSTANTVHGSPERLVTPRAYKPDMYQYREPMYDAAMDTNRYLSSQYYHQAGHSMYSTLPSKKTKFYGNEITERSVTPDITRGLERNTYRTERNLENSQHSLPRNFDTQRLNQNLGIPIHMPDINRLNVRNVPSNISPTYNSPQNFASRFSPANDGTYDPFSKVPTYVHLQSNIEGSNDSLKISPIDPRHSGAFKSSTPTHKTTELKAAVNLENKLLAPKKSTMSNEELYAVIHKSKKKLNIESEETPRSSPITVQETVHKPTVKSPETGYLGEKSRSRFSWSPSKGEYVDFNEDIDKLSPPNDSRSRQSWACNDRKSKSKKTSTLDFKRLLLQKSSTSNPKKLSAVEQLKLSKEQIKPSPSKPQPEMNILDLSSSPRTLVNRRFLNNPPGSPNREPKPPAKILSPRSQWRFASPRSDVLSSTILEDCREDESPNSSAERKNSPKAANSNTKKETSPKGMPRNIVDVKPYTSATQRLYAQRAQFFSQVPRSPSKTQEIQGKSSPPTLETAF